MDANQVAIIITAVGTCLAAIITAILTGSRWLLKVWFNYQLQVKKEEAKNNQKLVDDMGAQLKLHTKMLAEHKLALETSVARDVAFDKRMVGHEEKIEEAVGNYKANAEQLNKVLVSLKQYFEKAEEWKKKIETEIINLKAGKVLVRDKKTNG